MKLITPILDSLLPSTCCCCDSLLRKQTSFGLCEYCHYALPWLGHACSICALPLADHTASFCGQCVQKPPAFFSAKIPFRYDYPINQLILDFKFQHKLSRWKTLSQLMIDYLHDEYKDHDFPDAVIPVPMYWKRQFYRGFNQSELLANDIVRAFSLPLLKDICLRKHHQKTQKDSNKNTRTQNLKNAFSINQRKLHLIRNQHLALVDDVVTTSSTVREISDLLISHGAATVVVWSLARTPAPNSL